MNLKKMTCKQYFELENKDLVELAILHYKIISREELTELIYDLRSICGLDSNLELRYILCRELYKHITGKEFDYVKEAK